MSQITPQETSKNQANKASGSASWHAGAQEAGDSDSFELLDLSLLNELSDKRRVVPEKPAPSPSETSSSGSSQIQSQPPLDINIFDDPVFVQCSALLRDQMPEDASRILLISLSSEPDLRRSIPILAEFDRQLTGDPTVTVPARHSLPWLTYALILQPESPRWPVKLADSAGSQAAQWVIVADTILRYIKYTSSPDLLCAFVVENAELHLTPEMAQDLMIRHFSVSMRFDALFNMILAVPEKIAQPRQLLDKLDETISSYSGDAAQHIALQCKRYRLADILGDDRACLSSLKDIIEIDPSNAFALAKLHATNPDVLKPHAQILYNQLRIYTERDPNMRLQHQLALATLYTRSSQFNNAITLYHAIIDEHPEQFEARYQLLTLLESQENWKSAENVLLALINTDTSREEKFSNLTRLAHLQAEHMNVPSRALLSLFAAVDLCPEKLTDLHAPMCAYSDKMHSFSPLLDKYSELAENAANYETRKTAILLTANLYANQLKKPALACNALDDFYQRSGSSDPVFIRQVSDFYKGIRHWNGYVQSLSDLLAICTDSDQNVSTALEISSVYANTLGDHIRAAQYARIAAQHNPQNSEQWVEIANYLLGCESIQETVSALERAALFEKDPVQKSTRYLEIAQLLTNIDRVDQSVQAFETAIKIHCDLEKVTPIAETLISHATAKRNKSAFLKVCNTLVACCPEAEQSELMLQQALTLIRVFDDKQSARAIIEENTPKLSSIDLNSSYYLAQILTELDENTTAVQIVQKILNNFTLDDEQRLLCLQTWLTNGIALKDNEQIEQAAEAILGLDPEDASASFQLIRLDYIAGRWDYAIERIRGILGHMERLKADDAMLVHFYYGAILHASKNDDEALVQLDSAISITNTFRPAIDLKLTILLENQQWQEALPVFPQLIALTEDKDVLGAIHKRIAEIYHFYLDQGDKAIFEYELALTLGGDVEDVPYRLLQLYQSECMWQKAAMTAKILAMAQTNSPNAKCDYLSTLGEVQATHLGELNEATNTLLSAFEIYPLKQNVVTTLIPLLIRRQDWDNLRTIIRTITALLEVQPDEAAARVQWITQTCSHLSQCKVELTAAIRRVGELNITVPPEAVPPIPQAHTITAGGDIRHRLSTAPRGTLTVDSSLLRNPDPPRPSSGDSMMAVSKTPIPALNVEPEPVSTRADDVITAQNDPVAEALELIDIDDDIPMLPDDALENVDDVLEAIEEELPFVPDDAISIVPPEDSKI